MAPWQRPVVDQGDRLAALMDGDRFGHRLVAHRVEHGGPVPSGDVTGAPLLVPPKSRAAIEAVASGRSAQADPLAVHHHHLALAGLDAVPGHAPGGQLRARPGARCGRTARHLLVAAPAGAAHGVFSARPRCRRRPGGVAEAGLHAALGCCRVGALGGGTRLRMITSWPRRRAPTAARKPASPPPTTRTSVKRCACSAPQADRRLHADVASARAARPNIRLVARSAWRCPAAHRPAGSPAEPQEEQAEAGLHDPRRAAWRLVVPLQPAPLEGQK